MPLESKALKLHFLQSKYIVTSNYFFLPVLAPSTTIEVVPCFFSVSFLGAVLFPPGYKKTISFVHFFCYYFVSVPIVVVVVAAVVDILRSSRVLSNISPPHLSFRFRKSVFAGEKKPPRKLSHCFSVSHFVCVPFFLSFSLALFRNYILNFSPPLDFSNLLTSRTVFSFPS